MDQNSAMVATSTPVQSAKLNNNDITGKTVNIGDMVMLVRVRAGAIQLIPVTVTRFSKRYVFGTTHTGQMLYAEKFAKI